jgi:hypothetical protein
MSGATKVDAISGLGKVLSINERLYLFEKKHFQLS